MNALCEKRLQSSMFKWLSFYYFLEFHCKILNSYAIYCCKKMVKILNCNLYAKKIMALCLRVQFFWPSLYFTHYYFNTVQILIQVTNLASKTPKYWNAVGRLTGIINLSSTCLYLTLLFNLSTFS